MKIVYCIAGTYRSGGMERVLAGKVSWLSAHGYEVLVVTTDQRGREPFFKLPEGVRTVDLGIDYEINNGGSLLDKLIHYPFKQRRHKKALAELLERERPDITVSMFCEEVSFLPSLKDGSRKVLEVHFSRFKRLQYGRKGLWGLIDRYRSGLDSKYASRFDRFAVLTKEDLGYWEGLENVCAIPNASPFPVSADSDCRAHRIVSVGRLCYQKGYERLLQAWAVLKDSGRLGDWTLDIVGGGELRGELEAQAGELGIQDSLRLLPPTSDIASVYRSASILTLSSRYEGLPMAIIEGMSFGLPVVSFDCKCGPKDTIEDGLNGRLVPEGDVKGLAEALFSLMDDDSLRSRMGRSSLEKASEYDVDRVMGIWDGLFKSLVRPVIAISAVNIRKGGTLTILRDCLKYASSSLTKDYRVVALVHDKALCDYPGIEYMEFPDTIKGWGRRLWCEYVTMGRVSARLNPVALWLSLHDTTPRVGASRRAVYCQTSFPFMRAKASDLRFDPKIVLFTLFTKWAYRVNVKKNDYLIVQTSWLREKMASLLDFPAQKIIVAPPQRAALDSFPPTAGESAPSFLYPATPDCHKSVETLCEAARILEAEVGQGRFKVVLTIKGDENRYARYLYKNWSGVKSIEFRGILTKEKLFQAYADAAALVFPSRIETWGLPISEFMPTGKPMILSNLPYAHETAGGAEKVAYFTPCSPEDLAARMKEVMDRDLRHFSCVTTTRAYEPCASDWDGIFRYLL